MITKSFLTKAIKGLIICGLAAALPAIPSSAADKKFETFEEKIPGVLMPLKMVAIKGGKFQMAPIEQGGQPKEVEVKNFYISEIEVPWDIFDTFAFSLDMTEEEKKKDDALPKENRSRPSKPYGAPDHGFGHQGYAAISMTHKSAEKFCGWLSAKTGKKYRLPTEAEWEYAARAGGPAEVAPDAIDKVAWYWDNVEEKTQPVKTKEANAWGLHDVLGNAAEWVNGADGKPVARGGSYKTRAKKLSYALREPQTPQWNETDPNDPKSTWWLSDGKHVGFRVVCEE